MFTSEFSTMLLQRGQILLSISFFCKDTKLCLLSRNKHKLFLPHKTENDFYMAITLSTQIPQLLFSSAIPDLAINTDSDGEMEIALTSAGATVFTASHFPYNRKKKVFDLCLVVNYYYFIIYKALQLGIRYSRPNP